MKVLVDGKPLPSNLGVRLEQSIDDWPHAFWTTRIAHDIPGSATWHVLGRVPVGTRIEVDERLVHIETEAP